MRQRLFILAAMMAVLACRSAMAVKIVDITRLSGQRTNVIIGKGLVVGLKGTGDGGDAKETIAPLAALLGRFNDPVSLRDLANVQNVALVSVLATIPANGAINGDHIDCRVQSLGKASSLKGGTLLIMPMTDPMMKLGVFAMASGQVVIEDPTVPTEGIIKGGCVMEMDVQMSNVDESGKFTLIIDDPSSGWIMASTIAKIINDAEGNGSETIAVVQDAKTIDVHIPKIEQARPDSFISRVQRLPVPQLPTEARVVINEKKKTLTMTGDVEIGPVVITHQGLTISMVNPAPVPTPRNPVTTEKNVVALDTTHTGGAKLQDLVNALDQWKVPAEDKITIIKELHKTGRLYAKLIIE